MILNEKCFCKFIQTQNEYEYSLFLSSSYRQAQATVLEAIPRLKAEKITTKRPDDYYAQMAKSDEHMKKVKEFFSLKSLKNLCSILDSRIFS